MAEFYDQNSVAAHETVVRAKFSFRIFNLIINLGLCIITYSNKKQVAHVYGIHYH
jgi:hypothetical protein